jgi:hypothetical protein
MKNLLLFSTLLIATPSAFSQLTIKPTSAGADSFVYVNDEILFVKQEINLTRNGTLNDQEASIYLRNNGQLIQDGATSNNSGNGQLSVQQNTPQTNAWAYYYWCSPISHPAPAAGNRSFGVQHLYEPLPSVSVTAARQAIPITSLNGLTAPQMQISTRWLYTHKYPGTEAEGNYQRMNGNNAALAGYGFTMKGVGLVAPGHDQVYEFRGRPNSGTFTIPVGTSLMTLAGNPYPSALDLNKLYYDAENTALGTFWYYDENRNIASHYYSGKPFGYGVYAIGPKDTDNNPYNHDNLGTYTAAPFYYYSSNGGTSGTSTNPNPTLQGKRFAPIGQGIMFVGDANGDVKIKNSHRVFFKEGTESIFQRPTNENDSEGFMNATGPTLSTSAGQIPVEDRTPLLRLWAIFDDAVTRDMLLVFYDQATDGYDRGLDGLSAQDLKTDAYFPIGNDNDRKPYVINGIKYDLDKQIPIAFKVKNPTQIRLKVVEEINKPYDKVYLFDNQENTIRELNNSTASGLTFNLPAGNFDNRFFIIFRKPNLRPDSEVEQMEVVKANVDLFQNNQAQKLEVKNPEGYTIKSAVVYDMNGKVVLQENNLGSKNNYSFYTGNLSDGVYLVKLTTDTDVLIENKVIVHNR